MDVYIALAPCRGPKPSGDGNIKRRMLGRKLKSTVALLAILLLGAGISACGGGGKAGGTASSASSGSLGNSTSSVTPPGGYLKEDSDNDGDEERNGKRSVFEDDRYLLSTYPQKPNQAEARAITAVVKGYFAATAANEGARACSLLDASVVAGLGEGAGRSNMKSCATSLEQLLKPERKLLAAEEVATMVVTSVRLKGQFGLAFLGFRKALEGEILVAHEGHSWKIGALFDSGIP